MHKILRPAFACSALLISLHGGGVLAESKKLGASTQLAESGRTLPAPPAGIDAAIAKAFDNIDIDSGYDDYQPPGLCVREETAHATFETDSATPEDPAPKQPVPVQKPVEPACKGFEVPGKKWIFNFKKTFWAWAPVKGEDGKLKCNPRDKDMKPTHEQVLKGTYARCAWDQQGHCDYIARTHPSLIDLGPQLIDGLCQQQKGACDAMNPHPAPPAKQEDCKTCVPICIIPF